MGSDSRYEIGVKFFQILMPANILTGLLLNPICFYIYSKKTFSKSTTGFYLRVLSITDTIAIAPATFHFIIYAFNLDLKLVSSYGCKFITYLWYAPQSISAWFEALVSMDRAFSIAFPSRFAFREKRPFQYCITAFIIIFNYTFYFPMLIFFYTKMPSDPSYDPVNQTANMSLDYVNQTVSASCETWGGYYETLSWMDLMNSTLLPFSTMLVSTIVINKHLAKSRKNLLKNESSLQPQVSKASRNRIQSLLLINQTSHPSQQSLPCGAEVLGHIQISRRREQKDRSFAITSVAINVLFFLMNIGIVIMNLLATYNQLDSDQYMLFSGVTNCLFFMDFSVKFFVYFAANAKFRNEFCVLIRHLPCNW